MAFSISEKLCHHGIQVSELPKSVADVSVKVLVLLILVIENSSVLFSFFHTADLWIFPTQRESQQQQVQ